MVSKNEQGELEDARFSPIAAAFASRPTVCHVEARATKEKGVGLYATRQCKEGDVLIQIPLSACVTSSDAPEEARAQLPPSDTFGQLLAALLHLIRSDRAHHRQLAPYFRAVFGEAALATMIGYWDESSAAAQKCAHSVAARRARKQRAEALEEAKALIDAGLLDSTDDGNDAASPSAIDDYIWAKLVLQTRAFKIKSKGGAPSHALVPVLDLVNHVSVGPTCRSHCDVDGMCMQLIANFTIDPGDEISICYDPDADFLDVFERYGFFDETSVVHTAEVVVTDDALWSAASDEGLQRDARRLQLVENEAARGCDTSFEAWWVPDVAPDACPLFAAVRATLATAEELARAGDVATAAADAPADGSSPAEEMLKRPIEREAKARRATARLLRSHVDGYACSVEEARRELLNGLLDPSEEAATRLILFEQNLLLRHASALEQEAACVEKQSS
eukprot:TRINITY_DN12836_c0_g1_i1.p1 TRINITY_DN12836_c0_g1~~TRINITY_DN12836_c0_g1_i1.p1  ORF type:complete len:461 (+),score=104.89 TRINITY_DN12836_c0_g1_i1:39-1385(+)